MSLRSGKLPFLGSEDEFFYHTGSCFGFQRVAGAKPPRGAGEFTPTDSPTNSPDEPCLRDGTSNQLITSFDSPVALSSPAVRLSSGRQPSRYSLTFGTFSK